MSKNNIIDYNNPSQNIVTDVLSDFIRNSAQQMLQIALEEEVQTFILAHEDWMLTNGNKQVVRNGYLPQRSIQTGIGDLSVKVPKVRDRGKDNNKFTSSLIPQYMRRTVTMGVLLLLLSVNQLLYGWNQKKDGSLYEVKIELHKSLIWRNL